MQRGSQINRKLQKGSQHVLRSQAIETVEFCHNQKAKKKFKMLPKKAKSSTVIFRKDVYNRWMQVYIRKMAATILLNYDS